MSAKKERKLTMGDDDVCVVCFKDITIRCIMDCEHTICFECSTRLRILCEKMECPICRQESTIAVFTREKGTFRSLYMRALYNEDKYKLALEDEGVRRAYTLLLSHSCTRCQPNKTFPAFKQLVDHMLRQHQLQYCEICVEDLKIFTYERKLYTREKLALHKRKGDPDDSSHRGHPLCEYCEQRYSDKDELFLHLRRDHFHCHLCEADGRHIFYDDYEHLADHFRDDHFLCEQGQCPDEKFVVFRTDIDLQAHRASVHSDNKSRGQQRQDRTLTLEFSTDQSGRRRRNDNRYDRNDRNGDGRGDRWEPSGPVEPPPPPPPPLPSVNTSSQQEFPTLSAGGATGGAELPSSRGSLAQRVAGATGKTVRSTAHKGSGRPWDNRGVAVTNEDFPSLGGRQAAPPVSKPATSAPSFSVNVQRRAPKHGKAPGASRPATAAAAASSEDFPSLGGGRAAPPPPPPPAAAAPAFSVNVQRRAPKHGKAPGAPRPAAAASAASANDFPSLAAPQRPVSAPMSAPVRSAPQRAAPSSAKVAALSASSTAKVPRKPAPAKNAKLSAAGTAAGRSATAAVDFKRRPASAGVAMAIAAAAAAEYDYEEQDDDDVPAPRIAQATNTSNITIQRQTEPAPSRRANQGSAPPPLTKNAFPSLGKPAAASTTWVPQKAEPRSKPAPKPAAPAAPQAPVASDFPTLGPVAAYGNFGSFSAPHGAPAGGPNWGGDSGEAAAGKGKKKKSKKPASSAGVSASENGADSARSGENGAAAAAAAAMNGLSLSSQGPPPGLSRPPPGLPAPAPAAAARAGDGSFQYQEPENFTARNGRLVLQARDLFPSELEFSAFKTISQAFREAKITAEDYYSGCMNLLGNDKFGKMFPELLVLLPNIVKQQELLAAHEKLNKNGFQRNKFPSCPTCGQVLVFDDMTQHTAQHFEDGDFPALG